MSFEFIDTSAAALAASAPSIAPVPLDPAASQDVAGAEAMLKASDLASRSSSGDDAELLATREIGDLSLSDEDIASASENVVSPGGLPDFPQPLDQVPSESDTIVVIGSKHQIEASGGGSQDYYVSGGWYYRYDGGDSSGGESSGIGGGAGGSQVAAPADEDVVQITPTFEPTAEQKALLERFAQAVEQAVKAVNALPDNAQIRLEDGSIVTGSELKAIVAKMDFTINPANTYYDRNKTYRGEADYNGGDPKVSINVNILEGYDKNVGGLVYAALHEVGHMVPASRGYNTIIQHDGVTEEETDNLEEMANDIARAVASGASLTTLEGAAAPGYGYSTPAPMTFEPPSGGGGGGEYEEHPSH
jgi:hypothetical protein